MAWLGPLRISDLLSNCLDPNFPKPPERDSTYVISLKRWQRQPTGDAQPLYIGSNTGRSARFRTRIGDLLADMFGFYGKETGHSSGGQSLNRYCLKHHIPPHRLWIGGLSHCDCCRCVECELYETLGSILNQKRPPRCKEHLGTASRKSRK